MSQPHPSTCHNCDTARTAVDPICSTCHTVLIDLDDTFDPILDTSSEPLKPLLIRQCTEDLVAKLRGLLNPAHFLKPPSESIKGIIKEAVDLDPAPLSMFARGVVKQAVIDECFGFGPISQFLRDPRTQSIFCIGTAPIVVQHGDQLRKSVCAFKSDDHLTNTIDRLGVILFGDFKDGRITISGRLRNGLEMHGCRPPQVRTTTLSIRVARKN